MNMQYHTEHHMNPLMPFHQLPKFSKRIADQMPKPYNGLIAVYKEMLPALRKQAKDPTYFVERELPTAKQERKVKRIKPLEPDAAMVPMAAKKQTSSQTDVIASDSPLAENIQWHKAIVAHELGENDAVKVCINGNHYAIYQLQQGSYHATDGICSHEHAFLADGLVDDGKVLCPKHNSKFCIKTGKAINRPAKQPINVYPIKKEGDDLLIGLSTQ